MQLFFSSLMAIALLTGASLSYAEDAPKTFVSELKEKHMSPLSIVNMELAGLIQIHKALVDATDAESAEKSAQQLEVLRKKIQGFDKMIEELSDEEEKQLIETEHQMGSRFILLYKRCMAEGKRIIAAQYFNCEPLKEEMNSYEFADIVIPPPAPEKSAEESAETAPKDAPTPTKPDREVISAPLE